MKKNIDLRSDTVTRPSEEMLKAMMNAEVGDDVFGDDPTVNALEKKAADLFSKEASLFCPSGTMANQIAIKVHTRPGDEVICDASSHVYNFEGGGIAFNSGCSVRLIQGDRGRITVSQVQECINPDNIHNPVSRLVVMENTSNKGGGSYYKLSEIAGIYELTRQRKLGLHLDGARLFNALEESKDSPSHIGPYFDSISICLSKGLGAPVGSVLMGTSEFIHQARRVRKVLGGGMRQAGYLAAACIYALDHNVKRLREDHQRAHELGKILSILNFVDEVLPVDTNIVIFRLKPEMIASNFIQLMEEKGILVVGFGPQTIRMVTHLDFTDEMLEETKKALLEIDQTN